MSVKNLREKLNKIVSKEQSKWLDEAQWRLDNETSLELSQDVAMKILDRLEELGKSQKQLAKEMKVSAQYISKIVKGQQNITSETIEKFGRALGIKLVSANNTPSQNTGWRAAHETQSISIAGVGSYIMIDNYSYRLTATSKQNTQAKLIEGNSGTIIENCDSDCELVSAA
jgi:ribosome-binding protein aMBF1 (putative translation factor)